MAGQGEGRGMNEPEPRPIDRLALALGRMQSERDELRAALRAIVDACDKYDGVLPPLFLVAARAMLERIKP